MIESLDPLEEVFEKEINFYLIIFVDENMNEEGKSGTKN